VVTTPRPHPDPGVRAGGYARQDGFAYRFDWGIDGLRCLAPEVDVVIVVDVLRFTSAVSAAVEGGSAVLPFPWGDDGAAAYAEERDAILAGRREDGGPSLSPTDLLTLPAGSRLVLPSPNGGLLAWTARQLGAGRVLAGSLRNATATAVHARRLAGDGSIAVVACGERRDDAPQSIRPAFEDLVGAGAVLSALDPSGAVAGRRCSPEAGAARAAFQFARPRLLHHLAATTSGRELIDRGWEDDVATSAALDVTDVAAELVSDEFVARR
jgi:2-phosphosulfolactate phosphatase